MVTVGYNPSTGKALWGTGGSLCLGCCGGDIGEPCSMNCGSGSENITMPASITAVVDVTSVSCFSGWTCLPNAYDQTLTLYQDETNCYLYSGEITGLCRNQAYADADPTNIQKVTALYMYVVFESFNSLCSAPYQVEVSFYLCSDMTVPSDNCTTVHSAYRQIGRKKTVTATGPRDLTGMSIQITESDTGVTGRCNVPGGSNPTAYTVDITT